MGLRRTTVTLHICLALAASGLRALPASAHGSAQAGDGANAAAYQVSGFVMDQHDAAIRGANVQATVGSQSYTATTDESGRFAMHVRQDGQVTLTISAAGFQPLTMTAHTNVPVSVKLQVAGNASSVVVAAYRTGLPAEVTAASTRVLNAQQLQQSASPVLDDQLRAVPGVELFRRTSSLVLNPTSQGISLRGLGSTAASRTLVVSDNIPLNDAFGGWIHWDEFPALSVQAVEVVRGGASDLYGSSAVGGLLNIVRPAADRDSLALDGSYGGENTRQQAGIATAVHGPWSGVIAAGWLRTDGYTLIAPEFRGNVDTPSNAHAQNGYAEIRRHLGHLPGGDAAVFLRGNAFNEARNNGTPQTPNGTRLWRYQAGGDWNAGPVGTVTLRFFGSREQFRQRFSSILPGRTGETVTRMAQTPSQELGGLAQWTRSFGGRLITIAGTDLHDVRGADNEMPITAGQGTALNTLSARQRQTGVYGQGLLTLAQWTVSGSLRVDNFRNFDAASFAQFADGGVTARTIPDRSETVVNPKISLVRKLTSNVSLVASASRSFRSPTLSELYRNGQVGQKLTLANPALTSERATGAEGGLQGALPGRGAIVRTTYFWTEVNRPVTALTLNVSPGLTTLKRANLGQIRSRGLSIDGEAAPLPWLELHAGYQYAKATVTRFEEQPALVGNWIPQVARHMATAQVTINRRRWGTLSFDGHYEGGQFDDDANTFRLSPFFRIDAYASHALGRRLEIYSAADNLLDRRIQAGRTPILTLGTPLEGRIGLRIRIGS